LIFDGANIWVANEASSTVTMIPYIDSVLKRVNYRRNKHDGDSKHVWSLEALELRNTVEAGAFV